MPEVAVLGAVGYAGAIAAQLLYKHPGFDLKYVTARAEAGQRLDDVHPRTRVPLELEVFDVDKHAVEAAVVAYPHGAAAPVVAELRARGTRVVDLSADFRLTDRGIYDGWYGEHKAPELFGQGVYGLPELKRADIAGADLVANPGCYPTAALLGLAPLARAGLIGDVVIDAKSGVSGAGRGATHATHFISADENVTPYKIEGHRHTPEIEQELGVLGNDVTITFMPHLLPLAQGELVSCYVTPSRGRRRGARPSCSMTRTRARRSWSCAPGRSACSTCATPTTAGSRGSRTRGRAGSSSSRSSTTCGRARRRRPCRTST